MNDTAYTKEELAAIKAALDRGDMAEAQRVILDHLKEELGD